MPKRRTFTGDVRGGHFHPHKREEFYRHLKAFDDGVAKVSIGPVEKIRSNQQNSYYHAVVVAHVAEFVGLTTKEAHDLITDTLLGWNEAIELESGKRIEIRKRRSTADLSTVEFEKFAEDARMWAAIELGIGIPKPNEVDLDAIAYEVPQ